MKKKNYSISQIAIRLFAVLLLAIAPAVTMANPVQGAANPQLAKRVRHELVTLPYYGVFDNLAYSINGGNVTLYGQVVRPSTRSDAERRVKRISGVTRVVNNIEVLPLSGFDDQIRFATYRSIARMGRTLSLPPGCESVVAHRSGSRTRVAGGGCCQQRRPDVGLPCGEPRFGCVLSKE